MDSSSKLVGRLKSDPKSNEPMLKVSLDAALEEDDDDAAAVALLPCEEPCCCC